MNKKLNSILLIDDDDDDNEYNKIIINRMGITDTIHVARNGEEGLAFLNNDENEKPELILLDINMPRMNGWEFLEGYRKLCIQKKQIIILMLTTSVNPADMERAKMNEDVKGFKIKPLTKDMLAEILQTYF